MLTDFFSQFYLDAGKKTIKEKREDIDYLKIYLTELESTVARGSEGEDLVTLFARIDSK